MIAQRLISKREYENRIDPYYRGRRQRCPLTALIGTVVIAALTGFDNLFLLFGFIVGYRIFQDYALSPYLMSEGVEVPPLLVISGLLIGDEIAGVTGIFLSVPVMEMIKIIVKHAYTSQKLWNAGLW